MAEVINMHNPFGIITYSKIFYMHFFFSWMDNDSTDGLR